MKYIKGLFMVNTIIMAAVADAILKAKEEIFITDWM